MYVDISKFMDKKLRAMKCYKSELNDFPHPRSLKGIEVLAAKRGMEVSFRAAEAFRLVRGIA
jgi:LmbE family N-acetylglucosaminyl deacetylase